MASISSAGLGSGLDVNSIVTQLMAVERQPLTQMKSQADDLQTKVSAYGKLQSFLSSFRDAAAKLSQSATWNTVKVNSADATAVSVAGSAASGAAGSYSVAVSKLAANQTVSTAAQVSKTTALGASGTLSFEIGKWSTDADTGATGFAAKSGSSAVSIDVTATDTLTSLRDKINAKGAGVLATIVSDATGSRLVMRSSSSGTENGFRVTGSDPSLAAFTFDDPAAEASTGVKKLTTAAADAEATINGLAVKSSSNTLTDVIDGVSIKLSKVTTDPVDVSVESDTDTLKTNITDFAKAYNDLASYLTSQTKYNASTKQGATFQGDAGVNAIRSALRNLGSSSGGSSSALTRLADVGLDIQADGTIKTNTSKLSTALTKVPELKKLFVDAGSATGLASSMRSWGDKMLGTDGSITTRQTSLQAQITANTKKQSDFEDRMTLVEKRMRAQYTALDTQMAKISGMSSYVTQQLSLLSSG